MAEGKDTGLGRALHRRWCWSHIRAMKQKASVLEVLLSADLVLLSEVLYLVPEHIADILARVRAKYLLTSHYTNFDEPVSRLLQCLGWQTIISMQLTPRFEPVDGRTSFFLTRRPGSQITLWKPAPSTST
jgi:hypothetical protein